MDVAFLFFFSPSDFAAAGPARAEGLGRAEERCFEPQAQHPQDTESFLKAALLLGAPSENSSFSLFSSKTRRGGKLYSSALSHRAWHTATVPHFSFH